MQIKNKRKLGVKNKFPIDGASLKISTITTLYGYFLIKNPEVLLRYVLYKLVSSIISYNIFAMFFIILGLALFISSVINIKIIKKTFVVLLAALWSTWTVSFFVTPPPNSIWIFSLFITISIFEVLWDDNI